MALFVRLSIPSILVLTLAVPVPLAAQSCDGTPTTGISCDRGSGQSAVGAVFSASEAGGRRNVSLTLIEELMEEEAAPSGGGGGDGPTGFDLFAFAGVGWQDYQTENVLGQDSTTYGGLFGANYRGDNFLAGVAIDLSFSDVDFALASGTRDTTEYGAQVFGTYFPFENLFVSGAARIGFIDVDTRRVVRAGNIARGDTEGNSYGVTGGLGYSLPVGSATVIGISGWMVLEYTDIDGYAESGATAVAVGTDAPNLTFDDDSFSTLNGILRLEIAHAVRAGGIVWIPSARADYIHEFNSDTRTIDAELPPTSANDDFIVSYRTNDADENYFRLGASLTAAFDEGTSLSAEYSGVAGHAWREEHIVTLGFRHRF